MSADSQTANVPERLWSLRVTYADFVADEFLELGGAAWPTEAERDEHFDAAPEVLNPADDPAAVGGFTLDALDPDDAHTHDKSISEETARALLGQDLVPLLAMAREKNALLADAYSEVGR